MTTRKKDQQTDDEESPHFNGLDIIYYFIGFGAVVTTICHILLGTYSSGDVLFLLTALVIIIAVFFCHRKNKKK